MAENKDLPEDPHLREDISLPLPEPDNEDEHLAEDAGLPQDAGLARSSTSTTTRQGS